jgi:hypothetical protein
MNLVREYFAWQGQWWAAPPGTVLKLNEAITNGKPAPDPRDLGAVLARDAHGGAARYMRLLQLLQH